MISDYDHNMYVFCCALARVFFSTKTPPDYDVLFVNCHMKLIVYIQDVQSLDVSWSHYGHITVALYNHQSHSYTVS